MYKVLFIVYVLYTLIPASFSYYQLNTYKVPSSSAIKKSGTTRTEDLILQCDRLGEQCGGFDTNGNLYGDVSKLGGSSAVSTFVKQNGDLPPPQPSNLWPLPQHYSSGSTTLTVSNPLQFQLNVSSIILKKALLRYTELIFDHKSSSGNSDISTVNLYVSTADETLQLETDESYKLSITQSSATINAKTIYGAMRGLETLSQLIEFDFESKKYVIHNAPWTIDDFPKFPHRGVLVDTSRHFLPVRTLKRVIDSLSYAKYNVLHWHIVDAQSFPVESKKFPNLWEGSWSKKERYTHEDLAEIVIYAKERGVRVMPEFDGPGHMFAWGIGYPDLLPQGYSENSKCSSICPVNPCDVPIDPSANSTFDMLSALFSELTGGKAGAGIFTDNLLHLGGDEVQDDCWAQSDRIKDFMAKNNMTTYDQLYMYYIKRAHDIANSQGRIPVNWEEVFNHFGTQLNPNTIIHVWLNAATLAKVVNAGYRGILSNYQVWYLDQLGTPWTSFYQNDPLDGISSDKAHLVLGGESCMWGETVDPSDVFNRIWPKAAATAERLWNYNVASQSFALELALPRLHHFRCRLLERGIDSGPVYSYAPNQPSSCYYT